MRPKLSYANVISTVCLFLLLGGGAAYAASHLGKNSVGSKQLRKNAVTGAKVKDQSLTGRDINASNLGTVPSATHATKAETANLATEAGSVAGQMLQKVSFVAPKNTPATTLFDAQGL